MHNILSKKQLSAEIFLFTIYAPLIAREREPGQFILLQLNTEYGERIPLTIADASVENGTISIIFQTAGNTTRKLSRLNVGDEVPVIVGPLGTPTHIEKVGHIVCIGGGIGIAPLFPITQALHAAGNTITTIIGAQSKDRLFYTDEMNAISDSVILCSDDGSVGHKGFVTEPLTQICTENKPDLVIAIGPAPMMQACCNVTRPFDITTVVSLNSIMIDGTGMCGGCRVTVDGTTKFVCVDGPEFNGHTVEWGNMNARLNTFKKQEKGHSCRLPKESPDSKKAGLI
ncbi:MAG: sulfide/dihydroorotate dehydrogenase-like FAD/NAD-binding protein [Fibrobacterales bacterium]